jgi:hypothetical protein
MLKLISKALLPIAMIFAALFGASWAEGCPQYWYIVGIVILFLMSCAIDYVIDKLGSVEFYKNCGLSMWEMTKKINNKKKGKVK